MAAAARGGQGRATEARLQQGQRRRIPGHSREGGEGGVGDTGAEGKIEAGGRAVAGECSGEEVSAERAEDVTVARLSDVASAGGEGEGQEGAWVGDDDAVEDKEEELIGEAQ